MPDVQGKSPDSPCPTTQKAVAALLWEEGIMANDRIYIRCKKCGEYVRIAKYWCLSRRWRWGSYYNKVISSDSLDYWLDSHASCPSDSMTVDNLELINEREVVALDPGRTKEGTDDD